MNLPETWWTCGMCGRRSAWTPGLLEGWGEHSEFYKPSFWYKINSVLHCKDCSWRKTVAFQNTKAPPPGGWYPPCNGRPVIEYSMSDTLARCFVVVDEPVASSVALS